MILMTMKIKVDGKVYPSKKYAEKFFLEAMMGTDGSEQERMTFAYCAIKEGYTDIDTYEEIVK